MTYFFQPNSSAFVARTTNRPVSDVIRDEMLFRRIEHLANGMTTVRCHVTATRIYLEPTSPAGLPVSVDKSDGRQTLCIGSWHDDVDDDTAVLRLVDKAIHGQLRLRMDGDGRLFHTFTVEIHVRDDIWAELAQMSGYWFRKRPTRVVKYLRNKLTYRR